MTGQTSVEQPSVGPISVGRASPEPYTHLKTPQITELMQLHLQGQTQTEIAQQIGCSQATVARHLKALTADTRELASKFLGSRALPALLMWSRAAERQAAKGDHRAAQALAEAAMPELRGQQQGSGVQVNIGLVNSESALPAIQIAPLSPSSQLPESES